MSRMRIAAAVLCLVLLSACGGGGASTEDSGGVDRQVTELSLWVFPVGNWGNATAVSRILTGFHKQYPDIHVTVKYLDYADGDAMIEEAVAGGSAPDLVLEGPERLVSNWGARGLMADLSDLWESGPSGEIYGTVRDACRDGSGAYYEYPICMTTHCMAINYDLFREAGALQYIDVENHTWTTEGFIQAVRTLREYGQACAGVVYCKDQGGDQGTRALVNNLYGGTFTDGAHTRYIIDSPENIRALRLLYELDGIEFAPESSATDEIKRFCRGESAMTFCWNVSLEIQETINNPELNFDVYPIAFPTDQEQPELSCGIWGFGVFDNGDQARTDAAKELIRYLTGDDSRYTLSVQTSTYWPVRDMGEIYVNDLLMEEYSAFTPWAGDYYQITPGWTKARTAWWQLLQKVGSGADIEEAVKGFPAE